MCPFPLQFVQLNDLPEPVPPVLIKEPLFIDGALIKTYAGRLARGAELVLINPWVPIDSDLARRRGIKPNTVLTQRWFRGTAGGLVTRPSAPSFLRMQLAQRILCAITGTDVVLFEPNCSDADVLCQCVASAQPPAHAYQRTRQGSLPASPNCLILARHPADVAGLRDHRRSLLTQAGDL